MATKIVKPKPKPDDQIAIAKNRAANAALSQASQMAGGGANTLANAPASLAGGTPSAGCSPGTPTGSETPADPNNVMGPTTNAPGSLSGPAAGVNPNVLNMVRKSVPAGCRAQITPNGGVGSRTVGGSAHPKGLATDTNLFCGGKQQFAGSPQMNQYIQNLNANGARGLSYYNSGFVHADLMGTGQRRWGPNQSYVNSATRGENPGPGAAQAAGGAGAGGGGDPCAGGSGGGCQPVQSTAIQNAASLAQNKGFDVSSLASTAAGLLGGGSPISAAMGLASQAVQGALGSIPGLSGAIALGTQALSDPAGALTNLAGQAVKNMGASIMPSITGNLPAGLLSSTGISQDFIANKITDVGNQVFAKNSPPQLDKFISIFNAAQTAQGFASSLQETIGNTMNNVFGNAGKLFVDTSNNNWAKRPGVNPADVTLEGPALGEVSDAISNTIDRSQFIGHPEDVLKAILEKKSFNAFSTMFYDWDAYTTRGYGTITNNVIELGTDFKGLGKLADLNDILRIGTPGQIAQQIIINGAGATAGLLDLLIDNGLLFTDLSSFENDELVKEHLYSIDDLEAIGYVKQTLEMDENLNIETLGDLLDTKKLLPRSYDYNYFENINDIAVFLGMCNGAGQIKTLAELGDLLESFEVPFDSSSLEGDPAIYNYKDVSDFALEYAPVGFFTSDGSLSIADFIGTAAGYVHDTTAPRIAELQNDLFENTTYFDDYVTLVELLTDTANGAFYVPEVPAVPPALPIPAYVSVPPAGGYTFGDYATLDDAVTDIVGAIEAELTLVNDLINDDEETLFKLIELDSLHNESASQLAREHKLRKAYGLSLGSPKKTDQFVSDGITTLLPLTADINTEDEFNLYINGVWQSPSNYTVNVTNNTITLSSSPSVGTLIVVNYKTDSFTGIASKMQVWDFASNLENLATETGYGRAADFLRRIVTDDEHGQRINATLMNARNKTRSEEAGLACPNFETVNGAAPTYINYVDWTGVWTSDATRASEIWLQNGQDVVSTEEYLLKNINKNKFKLEAEIDIFVNNIVRQLIFFSNGDLAISDLMSDLYANNSNGEINQEVRNDLFIAYTDEIPTDGYVLGSYKEILSGICDHEGIKNSIFAEKISNETADYLKTINIDLKLLTSIIQRVLSVSLSNYLGLNEGSFREIFGIQSVSKAIMKNIVDNF